MAQTLHVSVGAVFVSNVPKTITLTGAQKSVLLSILTEYGRTLFFVDADGDIVHDNEFLEELIIDIIDKLQEPPP